MDDNKQRALGAALSQIERQFGKGSIMRMGDKQADMGIGVISTGSLGLDVALGIGGLPRGRIVEIYGPESSGKTTLTLQVVAEAQKAGGTAAFVDAEHALDPVYAEHLGVNVDDLLLAGVSRGRNATVPVPVDVLVVSVRRQLARLPAPLHRREDHPSLVRRRREHSSLLLRAVQRRPVPPAHPRALDDLVPKRLDGDTWVTAGMKSE